MTRRWVIPLAGVGLVAAALLLVLFWSQRGAGVSGGTSVAAARTSVGSIAASLPPVQEGESTRTYLAGPGRALVTVLHAQASAQVGSAPVSSEACRDRVARLQAGVPAADVVAMIEAVPDAPLREAFHAERTALGLGLTRCLHPASSSSPAAGPSPSPALDLPRAVGLVDLRLDAVGVRR